MDKRVNSGCRSRERSRLSNRLWPIILLLSVYSSAAGAYTVGVTVTGLTGSGLVLQNNRGDDLSIPSDGTFVFATPLASGAVYRINVLKLPNSPTQTCTADPVSGVVGSANVELDITCVPRLPRFAYVANGIDDTLSIYSVNATTGQLRFRSYKMTGDTPTSVTLTPNGRFVYVANASSHNISAYRVNTANGDLTQMAGSPFAAGSNPSRLISDPLGRFLYVVNSTSNSVSVYSIHPTSGVLTSILGSPFAAGPNPRSITLDPSGKFLYVANTASHRITAFAINASSGALSAVAGSPFAAGTSPRDVTIDASGRFAYVPNSGSDNVSVFSVNRTSGALLPVSGSPFAAGDGAIALTFDASGRFAYVANSLDDTVSLFSVDPGTGAMIADLGAPVAVGEMPVQLEVEPAGKYIYVVNADDHTFLTFEIRSTGVLTRRTFAVGRRTPREMAISPGAQGVVYEPQFAYVGSGNTGPPGNTGTHMYGYSIAPASGMLTEVSRTPLPDDALPVTLVADGANRFLFAATHDEGSDAFESVYGFNIQPTGMLTSVAGSPFNTVIDRIPEYSVIDPTGRFLYIVTSSTAGGFVGNAINQITGSLTYVAGSPFAAGTQIGTLAMHPTGRWLFARVPGGIRTCSIAPSDGALTQVSESPLGRGAYSMSVDPGGRFLFVAEWSGTYYMSSYAIDSVSGTVTLINRLLIGDVNYPTVAVDPLGRFVFVTLSSSGYGVYAFSVQRLSGALTMVPGSPFITGSSWPLSDIAVESSGSFVYVAQGNRSGAEIAGLRINPVTGALSLLPGFPVPTGTRNYVMTTTGTVR